MGAQVDVWTWPPLVLDPAAQVTFVHTAVFPDGRSAFDPEHWYWMSAVPDFDPAATEDRPVGEAAVEIVSQYGSRPAHREPGLNDTVWIATWQNRSKNNLAYFHPRILHARS